MRVHQTVSTYLALLLVSCQADVVPQSHCATLYEREVPSVNVVDLKYNWHCLERPVLLYGFAHRTSDTELDLYFSLESFAYSIPSLKRGIRAETGGKLHEDLRALPLDRIVYVGLAAGDHQIYSSKYIADMDLTEGSKDSLFVIGKPMTRESILENF